MVDSTSRPYSGPIFDVQAHAIKPSSYDVVTFGKLADDLCGSERRRALGREGKQVVTINTFFPTLPAQSMLKIVDDLNMWMSSKTAGNPRLIGTASIPSPPFLAKAGLSPNGQSFAKEGTNGLRYAITTLGLKGILFASNYDGVFLGDSAYDPYVALAEELAVPIIIHPAVDPVDGDFIRRKNIPTFSGFLNDQRTTLLDLVMAGTLQKYPKLVIIATHLGGGILTSLGRFKTLSNRFPGDQWYTNLEGNKQILPHPIDHYLKMIHYDCNNAEVSDILHAASIVGVDHLLTGSDYPWTDDSFTRQILGQLDESMRNKLAYDNAVKLFGHDTSTLLV